MFIFNFRELLSEMCPKPTKHSKFHSLNKLQQKKEKFAQQFERLQNYVERNRKFPEFNEDFSKILQNKTLSAGYKSFKYLKAACYHRNKGYINQRKKFYDKNQFQELFDFLKKALEYQKNNLAWFTSAKWFDQNSEKIYAHFETKSGEKNNENLQEESKINHENVEKPPTSPNSEKNQSKKKNYFPII